MINKKDETAFDIAINQRDHTCVKIAAQLGMGINEVHMFIL